MTNLAKIQETCCTIRSQVGIVQYKRLLELVLDLHAFHSE